MIQRGVHINGYVKHPDKGMCMWIAKRSPNKQTFPSHLDQIVREKISLCILKPTKIYLRSNFDLF